MRDRMCSYPKGWNVATLQHLKPIKQRPIGDVRVCARCWTKLARDNFSTLCSPCATHQELRIARYLKALREVYDLDAIVAEAEGE